MKLGWFTPFDPRSAVGDYSETVLAGLAAAGDEVTVFAPEATGYGEPRPSRFPVVRLAPSSCEWLERFDLLVFNLGHSPAEHRIIGEIAACRPGLIVLHDLCAAVEPALRRCLGVVVSSDHVLRRIREVVPAPATKIDPPLCGASARPPARPRLAGDRVRLLTAGPISPDRMIHATLRAIRRSDRLRRQVTYRVIGEADASYYQRLQSLIGLYGLGGEVELSAGQPSELLSADVVIHLRNPDHGDSPAGLIESLAAGLPTVVWDHGLGAELPGDVVAKVSREEDLGPLLEQLVNDPGRRQALGQAARAYARERFHPGRYCESFRSFAELVLRHVPLLGLVDRVSDRLLELGAGPTDGLAERVAAELSLFVP
jgi:glycosyltransferase involved in cell wall biosynthesis